MAEVGGAATVPAWRGGGLKIDLRPGAMDEGLAGVGLQQAVLLVRLVVLLLGAVGEADLEKFSKKCDVLCYRENKVWSSLPAMLASPRGGEKSPRCERKKWCGCVD